MKKYSLVPDFIFDTFDMADADFLEKEGIRFLILDIDNTLEPYENPVPGDGVRRWFSSLENRGIKAAFVSNNNHERVSVFNSELGYPMYAKAKKPFRRNVLRAMKDMGATAAETALMGDQIFTDVWAARNAGIRAILVPPIKDKTDLFTRFKRVLERPIKRRYMRKKGK